MAAPSPAGVTPAMIPPAHAPAFLAAHGWADAEIRPLADDASFRRYFRIVAPGRTAVLMDAPPERESIEPFERVARHLLDFGFSAPRPLAVDRGQGLLLLEDFGDALVGRRLRADPAPERAIYRDAVALLAELATHAAPADLAPYDRDTLQQEAALLLDWYAPAFGLDVDRAGFVAAWDAVLPQVATPARPVLVHRDFHADNLMLLDRPALARLGLLDFQDALAGHPAYDLVSLLQDARRDVSPILEAEMLSQYLAATDWDRDSFCAAYETLGAQRNVKILGIFTRLWERDGKPAYLALRPRVWGYLERNLAHPALAPVARWFDANIPARARGAAAAGA